jgi:hypothetical protein
MPGARTRHFFARQYTGPRNMVSVLFASLIAAAVANAVIVRVFRAFHIRDAGSRTRTESWNSAKRVVNESKHDVRRMK